MSDTIDDEIGAIGTVLKALEPLLPEVRVSVLNYVVKRLQISMDVEAAGNTGLPSNLPNLDGSGAPPTPGVPVPAPTHIKALKEQKQPRSANEMAALVAYYLSHVVPASERKPTISTSDIETQFKIAEFPLPHQSRMTLGNAKTAGYFDVAPGGGYKLNAVGHNLVVHSMPRKASADRPPKRRPKAKQKAKATTAQKKR
ncbi:MAG TPA: hypothetical protein VF928_00690 [Usitatibacteraceae bacterium]